MRLRHPLIEHSPAAAADQRMEPAAPKPMFLEGDDSLAMLPAEAQIVTPAILASLDWGLIGCHGHPSSVTTIPQKQEIARASAHYYQIVIIWAV